MNGFTVTGDQVLMVLGVCLMIVLIAVVGPRAAGGRGDRGHPVAGDPLPGVQRHAGVGGARGARAAGRLHPGRRADRLDRARLVASASGEAVAGDEHQHPRRRPRRRDATARMPPRRVPRWTSDRRAAVATRPTSGLDRAASAPGRQLLHARLRRRTDGGSSRSRAREVLRWLVRNSLLYPLTGVWVLTRRWWEARTNARYERQMRAAEAAGDQDRLTEWEARAERAREQRHRRRMDWITAPHRAHPHRRRPAPLAGRGTARVGRGAGHRARRHQLGPRPAHTVVQAVAWLVWLVEAVWRPLLITLAVAGGGRGVAARPPLRRAARAGPHPPTAGWTRPWSSPRAGSPPRSRIWASRR